MKKSWERSVTVLLAVCAMSLVASAVYLSAEEVVCAPVVETEDGSGVKCFTLTAGQSIDAGVVCATVIDDDLLLTYQTTGGWELQEAHLWIGLDLADMPQTKKGSPIPGQFPYVSGDITGATEFSVVIPLAEFGIACPDSDTQLPTLYIAAHATVQLLLEDGSYQTETGWSAGDRILEKGNWATYSTITLSCVCEESGDDDAPEGCETAFAYSESDGNCFLDWGFNRWGWTIQVFDTDPVEQYPIYAAAGQCDTSKGTLVGYLMLDLANSTATMYTEDGFRLREVQFYIGEGMFPTDVNGEATVAPGQYPYVFDQLADSEQESFTFTIDIPAWAEELHVVAHAVVCGDYGE